MGSSNSSIPIVLIDSNLQLIRKQIMVVLVTRDVWPTEGTNSTIACIHVALSAVTLLHRISTYAVLSVTKNSPTLLKETILLPPERLLLKTDLSTCHVKDSKSGRN